MRPAGQKKMSLWRPGRGVRLNNEMADSVDKVSIDSVGVSPLAMAGGGGGGSLVWCCWGGVPGYLGYD